jgi:DNA modification methylase
MKKKNAVTLVKTSLLIPNKKKKEMYETPENYDSIKLNIEDQGIIEPLLVNKETMEVISGNIRLQIALELNIKEVPVIFEKVDNDQMDIKSISTNQNRIKSYMEILKEIEFYEEHYKVKKGGRTDLDQEQKEIKSKRDSFLKSVTRDTRDKIKMIDKLATELYGKDSIKYKRVFQSLDNKKTTLNGQYQTLLDLSKRKHNESVIPETHTINSKYTKVYNKSSEDMSEVETGSINTIITSPPYFQMKDYGTGKEQLGMESSVEKYLDNLMPIFKECQRVLREDGSLFVNINDCVIDGKYQAVPHKFIIKMIEMGWIFNDELLWIKTNPTYTRGKRSVRSHEPIYHFVKSNDFYYNDNWVKGLTDTENSISYGTNKENPKILSGLDFRDYVLKTNVSSTAELRKECQEKKNFYLTHNATFPLDVPTICALLTTRQEDIILDCFSGTSVVGEFARRNNRYFIGYEFKSEFALASEVRLIKIPPPWSIEFNYYHNNEEKKKGKKRK